MADPWAVIETNTKQSSDPWAVIPKQTAPKTPKRLSQVLFEHGFVIPGVIGKGIEAVSDTDVGNYLIGLGRIAQWALPAGPGTIGRAALGAGPTVGERIEQALPSLAKTPEELIPSAIVPREPLPGGYPVRDIHRATVLLERLHLE